MSKAKFEGGNLVATAGVAYLMETDHTFRTGVLNSLNRHFSGDWGDMDEEDCETNEEALQHGFRIMSDYSVNDVRIWIITEADRSATTVLFPEEY